MTWLLYVSLIVAAQPAPAAAPAQPTSILVLKSGEALEVESYSVEGRLVRIVGLEHEPLVMQTEQVDLEESREATEQHHARLRKEAEAFEAAEARARERAAREAEQRTRQEDEAREAAEVRARARATRQAEEQALKEAAALEAADVRARERAALAAEEGSREAERSEESPPEGDSSVASGPGTTPPEPAASDQPHTKATEAKRGGEAEQRGEAYYRGKNKQHTDRIKALEDKLYVARGAYEKAKTDATIGGATPQEQIDYDNARKLLEQTEKDLAAAREAYAQFKEDARRAGAYPGWLR